MTKGATWIIAIRSTLKPRLSGELYPGIQLGSTHTLYESRSRIWGSWCSLEGSQLHCRPQQQPHHNRR